MLKFIELIFLLNVSHASRPLPRRDSLGKPEFLQKQHLTCDIVAYYYR